MKKILTAVAAALLLLGCAKQVDDHSEILEKLAELDNRVTALESAIASIQSAIGDGVFVQKVEEYVDPDTGKTVGVTVTYTTGKVAYFEIKPKADAAAPVLGVIRNGAGELVWAVDGIAIQVDGKDVPVHKTPVFSVDGDGNLIVEVDGQTTNLGPVKSEGATLEDGIFTNLAVTDEAVVLTLSDGSTVNIPFAEAFQLNIETTEFEYGTKDPITIPYTVTAKTAGTVVGVSGYNPRAFKVEVDESNIVITPLTLTESVVMLAYADSKVGLTSFVNIVVVAEGTEVGPKDLSKKGTANSYIVTEAGEYKIKAVKGNTDESVGSVASAEILWETWNNQETVTANSVIASVAVDGDYITFATPATFQAGNALIAAKDASGTILWSWHIWLPSTPVTDVEDANFSTKKTMSRHLGALVDATFDAPTSVESFGLLYEWGRKDPFPGLGVLSGAGAITVAGTVSAQEGPMSVEDAIKNPNVYAYKAKADWAADGTDTASLWGETAKTVYDPCPAGYMLPQRNKSCAFWSGTKWTSADVDPFHLSEANCSFTVGSLVFPISGYIDDGGEGQKKAGTRTIVWSGRWDSGTVNGYGLYGYTDDGIAFRNQGNVRARGGSVRCVTEE